MITGPVMRLERTRCPVAGSGAWSGCCRPSGRGPDAPSSPHRWCHRPRGGESALQAQHSTAPWQREDRQLNPALPPWLGGSRSVEALQLNTTLPVQCPLAERAPYRLAVYGGESTLRVQPRTAPVMIVFIFSSIFAFFSNSCVFSPTPPHFFPTFPILRCSERVLYSAHKYALSGYTNVPTNRPIPAHPPYHPPGPPDALIRPRPPPPPYPAPPGPPPRHPTRSRSARSRHSIPTRARPPPFPQEIVGSGRMGLLTCGAGAA